MEEARQHPAVTRVDWVVIGGKVVLLLGWLALIVLLSFGGGRFVVPIATASFGVAAVLMLIRLGEGAIAGRIRGSDYILRAERPVAFWGVMVAYAGGLIIYAAALLLSVDLM